MYRVGIEPTYPRLQGGAFTRPAIGTLRGTPCRLRSDLAGLKDRRPHQKSNGAYRPRARRSEGLVAPRRLRDSGIELWTLYRGRPGSVGRLRPRGQHGEHVLELASGVEPPWSSLRMRCSPTRATPARNSLRPRESNPRCPARCRARDLQRFDCSRGRDRTCGRTVNSRLRCHFATLECGGGSWESRRPFSLLVEERPPHATQLLRVVTSFQVVKERGQLRDRSVPAAGVEPTFTVSETVVLPLDEAGMDPRSRGSDAARNRTEPCRLRAGCSALELQRHHCWARETARALIPWWVGLESNQHPSS